MVEKSVEEIHQTDIIFGTELYVMKMLLNIFVHTVKHCVKCEKYCKTDIQLKQNKKLVLVTCWNVTFHKRFLFSVNLIMPFVTTLWFCVKCIIFIFIYYSCFRMYPAMETLIEPHRLIACMNCIVSVARAMLRAGKWYPEGRSHVLPLLNLSLPGIDPNDFKKCLVNIKSRPLLLWYIWMSECVML